MIVTSVFTTRSPRVVIYGGMFFGFWLEYLICFKESSVCVINVCAEIYGSELRCLSYEGKKVLILFICGLC